MDENQTYQVGFATVDVTPPVGIYLAGFAARTDPSDGVYHALRSSSVVIDDGTNPIVIVGAEILGFYERTEATRKAIADRIDIDPANIILNGSHTHCGPCIREMDRARHGDLNEDYVEELIQKVADCTKQAWDARSPGKMRMASGACGIAASRRKPDGEGGVEWKCDPSQPCDHQVPVIEITGEDGALRGVIFSYACHPTSRGGTLIGGDYVAFAWDRIEAAHPGVSVCFLQGCAGDQKTIPAEIGDGSYTQREIPEIEEIGSQLGDVVVEVLKSDAFSDISGPISITQTFLDLETELIDMKLVEAGLDDERSFVKAWATHLHQSVESETPEPTTVPFEVQTVTFGSSLAIVTFAAEMTVEHGLRLKRELAPHFSDVLIAAYSNAGIGYVPVKRQISEGGYEVWFANQYHKRTGPYVEGTEDQIHSSVHRSLGVTT